LFLFFLPFLQTSSACYGVCFACPVVIFFCDPLVIPSIVFAFSLPMVEPVWFTFFCFTSLGDPDLAASYGRSHSLPLPSFPSRVTFTAALWVAAPGPFPAFNPGALLDTDTGPFLLPIPLDIPFFSLPLSVSPVIVPP